MKIKHLPIVLILLLIVSIQAWSAAVVEFDPKTGNCLSFDLATDENKYSNLPNYMIFTDKTPQTVNDLRSLLKNKSIQYFKKTGNPQISEMSQSEKFSVDGNIDYSDKKNKQSQIKQTYKNDLVIQALIQIIAEENGKTISAIEKRIDEIVKEKLKLKN